MIAQPTYPENKVTNPSHVFAEALREDSNREMDWLWIADEVTAYTERLYCLQRALYINPKSRKAQDALRRMERQQRPQPAMTPQVGFMGNMLKSLFQSASD